MRLWHKELIKHLPKSQLLAQWRELNSLYKKQDKHILINFVYDYDKKHLFNYSALVIEEFYNRGYKIKSLDNFLNYFQDLSGNEEDIYLPFNEIYKNKMNEEYLKICCWNLYEKYLCGQKDFTQNTIDYINIIINS